jgi:hypothetical protein
LGCYLAQKGLHKPHGLVEGQVAVTIGIIYQMGEVRTVAGEHAYGGEENVDFSGD